MKKHTKQHRLISGVFLWEDMYGTDNQRLFQATHARHDQGYCTYAKLGTRKKILRRSQIYYNQILFGL